MTKRFENCFRTTFAWLLLAVAISGCARPSDSSNSPSKSNSRTVTKTNGPVELNLQIEPENINLSDDVQLTLAVRKPPNIRIQFPDLAGQLDDFLVAGTKDHLPAIDGDKQVVRRDYQLQPKHSGDVVLLLPPVYFSDSTAPENVAEKDFVELDPIELKVASEVLTGDIKLETIRQPRGPVELAESKVRKLVLWIVLAVSAVAIVALIIALKLMAYRKRDTVQLTPRETALRELQRLIDSQLSQTDCKRYYVELTAIVRRYIERTTSIRAPELTTEEFLREISSTENFPAALKLNLKAFLESADLVKFAGQNPTEQELTASVQKAREFIETQWQSGGAAQ